VAFVGESGAGKSTLAAALDRLPAGRCERVADDIVPLVLREDAVAAEPHYPQLKLAPEEQYPVTKRESLTLAALYALHCGERGAPAHPRSETLGPADSLAAVAGQTVAARLFDPPLLDAHLTFCQQVVQRIPVRRLRYPRTLDVVPEIAGLLRRDLLATRL
jgi:hypothetical protein